MDSPYCVPIGIAELAAVLEVTAQTVRRWARGAPIPRTAQLAMRTAVLGVIDHPQWTGWRIAPDGRLWAPHGPGSRQGFTSGDLEWWGHVYETNRALWRAQRAQATDAGASASPSPSRRGRPSSSGSPS